MEDLVIKISDRCNFKCEFCSSNEIATSHKDLDIEVIKKYLLEHDVNNIIVNGGDPLMVAPEYYWELLRFEEENNLNVPISLTTNLWDFYLHPDKWIRLFRHKNIYVSTSFQYGTKRKLADGRVFTEEMFREIYDLYELWVGEQLIFIAVIDEDNKDSVLKTVRLAKELGTVCRVNNKLNSGRATTHFPYHKMFEYYLDIIEAGLADYELNSKLILNVWKNIETQCPYCRNCEGINCMNPDGSVTRCPSISDDILKDDFNDYFKGNTDKIPAEYTYIKPDCFACEFFNICCSCHKRIIDIKNSNTVNEHCTGMKKQLIRARRLLG